MRTFDFCLRSPSAKVFAETLNFRVATRASPPTHPPSSNDISMPRPPLTNISGNSRRGKELTPDVRGFIAGLRVAGFKAAEIRKKFRVPESTTKSTINKVLERINNESLSRPGRPPSISDREKRRIVRFVRLDPKITYRNLRKALTLTVSDDTIYRLLKEEGIKNWVA